MEVVVRPTKPDTSWLAARLIAAAIKAKPQLVLGLATGRTMERLYAKLVQIHREERLDFSLVRTFNLDEYIGLPEEDENSYRYYMNHHLFDHINIDKRNTFLPDGMTDDEAGEGERYEAAIQEAGGIDLQLLGIGRAGHIGFNEPLSALQSRTRAKALTPLTIAENSGEFADPARIPRRAITMGVGTILEAKRLLVLVTGDSKAEILAKAIEGPITSMISATAIQLHRNVHVICDEEAAAGLSGREYYDWIFANEPEWEAYR
ncbi:MAG: glucosamine-6-phosphate deaminase [Kiritimatiellia bacterium]|jgi:glucosamine-6-phosphate deaminase|nr:glucosamine-6-phosphate deaminase [Kiritimatiellia bacterium]